MHLLNSHPPPSGWGLGSAPLFCLLPVNSAWGKVSVSFCFLKTYLNNLEVGGVGTESHHKMVHRMGTEPAFCS